ncbi:MAG TPA: HNH endonuclease signature motif containing protein [Polyangiaceae bacterium]
MSDATTVATLLRNRCTYDRAEGALYRKLAPGLPAGQRLGCFSSSGKRQAEFAGKRYQVDALVWLWETGELPGGPLTHLNLDNGDDRFENLALGRRRPAPRARPAPQQGPKPPPFRKRKTPEEKAATARAYVEQHRDLYRAAGARSRAKMRAERPQEWVQLLQRQNARRAEWSKTPAGRRSVKASQHKRRARTRGVSPGLTREEWVTICEQHANADGDVLCAYCGKPCDPTVDHVVPLVRGGVHEASNVVPACLSCNSSKGSKLLSEWKRSESIQTI